MLKLERDSTRSGLTVRWREREGLFEPGLLQAFALALVGHACAGMLVHIAPLNSSSHFLFPPVRVQSDGVPQEQTRMVSSDLADTYEELLPPFPASPPPLDWLPLPSPYPWPLALPNWQAFEEQEERLWPSWQEPLTTPIQQPLVQLVLTGRLVELPLVGGDPRLDYSAPLGQGAPLLYVSYRVRLEASSGAVFWYEQLRSSQVEAADRISAQILLNLRFQSFAPEETVTGEVHVALSPKLLEGS